MRQMILKLEQSLNIFTIFRFTFFETWDVWVRKPNDFSFLEKIIQEFSTYLIHWLTVDNAAKMVILFFQLQTTVLLSSLSLGILYTTETEFSHWMNLFTVCVGEIWNCAYRFWSWVEKGKKFNTKNIFPFGKFLNNTHMSKFLKNFVMKNSLKKPNSFCVQHSYEILIVFFSFNFLWKQFWFQIYKSSMKVNQNSKILVSTNFRLFGECVVLCCADYSSKTMCWFFYSIQCVGLPFCFNWPYRVVCMIRVCAHILCEHHEVLLAKTAKLFFDDKQHCSVNIRRV